MGETYKCATCGKVHEGLPMSFAADSPDMYADMTRNERDARCIRGSDQYVIDNTFFYVRGCLEIPIIDSDEVFLWGVWASVREEVFDEISECWNLAGRENIRGPFKGRIANSLSVYPTTLNLKIQILIQRVGQRPLFLVEENDHQLATEQRLGIDREKAMALAALLLHQEPMGFPGGG